MNDSDGYNDQESEQSTDFYANYKDDPTLSKEVQPCRIIDLVQYADIFDKILIFFGCIFALGNGVSLIFYAAPLKNLIMAFDPYTTIQQIKQNVSVAITAFIYNSILVLINASFMTVAWKISSQRQLIRLRNIYYKSLLKQQFAWYDRNKPEDVCSQMYIQTQRAQTGIVESLISLLTSFSMTTGGIVFAFTHGWKMALVISLFMPVMIITNYVRARLWTRWGVNLTKRQIDMNGYIIQLFQNIKTVKYLAGQEYQTNKFNEKIETCSDEYVKLIKKNMFSSGFGFFCILFNYALAFWYGAKLIADRTYNDNTGKIYDVGDVISIFFCIYISNLNISNIPNAFSNLYNSRIAVTRIMNIINRKPRQSQGNQECLSNIKQIQFKNVSFYYNKPLFDGLNLKIKKGIVAIIGSSGNGKSTLVNLIMKFYEPFKGSIILKSDSNSQHIKNIDSKSLRQKIGYVGQEPVLLGQTICQVLGYSNNFSQQYVWHILEICCADFAKQIGLYNKFHALSGGQKQRIAIARAIMREPEILILDEGTSALDPLNEKKLLTNLKSKTKIKFIIMIAHRLQTLSEAQTIIKVENGLVEITQINNIKERLDQQKQQNAIMVEKQTFEMATQVEEIQNKQKKQQQMDYKFQWKYIGVLFNLNKQKYRQYILSISSSMLLGFIFPSFSYIITVLCSIATDLKYAKTDQEIEILRNKSAIISLMLIIISVLSILFTIAKQYSSAVIGQTIIKKLKRIALSTLINFQMAEIDRLGKASLIQVITGYCEGAKQMVSSLVINISEDIFTLICGLSIAFIYCWQITIFSLLLIPLSLIFGKFQQLFLTSLNQNADKVQRTTHEILSTSIIHNRTIKSLNLEDSYYQKYSMAQWKAFKKAIKHIILSGITLGMSQSMVSIMISMIYYVGAIFIEIFDIKIIDLFTAIYAVMFSGVQVGCHIGLIGQFTTCRVSVARLFSLINLQQHSQHASDHKKTAHETLIEEQNHEEQRPNSLREINGLVQFRNIHYKYSNRSQYLFQGLSFSIKHLQTLAIVGQSGNGKTTIADLLLNIYKPAHGQILIDGVDLSLYQKKELSHNLSIVSQEPALFNRSVYQNIKYNSQADINQVYKSAKIAQAFEFIEKGGFGNQNQQNQDVQTTQSNWQRTVGSRGSLLSGGQKQRVAIARAIVRKPKILILDEATSALDKDTEQKVIRSINKEMKITKLVIAHRLSTIKLCDRIIVLKEGKLVQNGTYQQLIQEKGQFFKLVSQLQNK